LELVVQCERLGFDEFWVGEHHSSARENIVMSEIFIAKALALTEHIRYGPAPVCLQYHHPVHVANRLAFLDHLSHGRLNVCFGPSAIPTDMELFAVDPEDSAAHISEAVDMIIQIWTSDPPYDLTGKLWTTSLRKHLDSEMGIGGLYKPLQRPYPPIAVPSINLHSPGIRKAAARGLQRCSTSSGRTTCKPPRRREDRPLRQIGAWPAISSWPTPLPRPRNWPAATHWADASNTSST
jgi:alkanesulfonate monooxygenase SsuD/methylene tetrahydromethanopterin reductase-like flavin-dependent oxidoreductase (luciferase family)